MENKTTYKKVASHEAEKGEFSKCLLLYSGGLDTSIMLKWIQEEYNCEVIALTINIGQTADDLDAIKTKGLKLGAKEVIVYDAKEESANKYLSQALAHELVGEVGKLSFKAGLVQSAGMTQNLEDIDSILLGLEEGKWDYWILVSYRNLQDLLFVISKWSRKERINKNNKKGVKMWSRCVWDGFNIY